MADDLLLRSRLAHARGVIGRYPDPGQRVVFEFESVAARLVHMVGVHRPLAVEWWDGDTRTHATTLRPWVGVGRAPAYRIVEAQP